MAASFDDFLEGARDDWNERALHAKDSKSPAPKDYSQDDITSDKSPTWAKQMGRRWSALIYHKLYEEGAPQP